MTVSDFQINRVIKTYMKNIKVRMSHRANAEDGSSQEDSVIISEEGMKRVLFERIGEKMTERLKRHEHEK
jgi:predicted Fe-Mo cluster-binding NifX family protein